MKIYFMDGDVLEIGTNTYSIKETNVIELGGLIIPLYNVKYMLPT